MKASIRLTLIALGVALASACSHMPELPHMSTPGHVAQATPGLSPRERVSLAVGMLDEGNDEQAAAELRAALQEQPNNRAAQRLLQQITEDPRVLLGANAHPYTVRAGETMSELSDRYLGDPLMFYALTRYNGLEAPNQLSAGQRLMIPHRPGVTAASAAAPVESAPPPAPAAIPQPRGIDAARANQLRLQGLQQLNAGNVEAAITLLRQAQMLDDANPAIQRDLNRALRLQAALSGGPG
jgi:Tfp pilus assembly protein PilF